MEDAPLRSPLISVALPHHVWSLSCAVPGTRIAKAHRGRASADHGANPARYRDNTGHHRDQAPRPGPHRLHLPDRRARRAIASLVGDTRAFPDSGLDRKHWSSAGPIRTIFKAAVVAAALPYFNPHSFRKTLALLGGQICKSPEVAGGVQAWSENLGYENVLTTFSSYGDVAGHRQAEIIRTLGGHEHRASV